ncbi:MAG TPA: protein kinase [bacterium]|nr:protein kinase [bacterium]
MMDAATERAEEIFHHALSVQDPGERQAYVEQACAGDAAIRFKVQELLRLQSGGEELFRYGTPAITLMTEIAGSLAGTAEAASEDENIQTPVGPYKLLQKIGEGGCGVVYMAEQQEPLRRLVALKIIKLGMNTKAVIARFKAEQQALALMDHPNIARVLDAGATASGRPYFAMELVRGIKLTTYCDENGLDVPARLKLFIAVCHAVQHAHQKGIIHRDIKPSNILVTLDGGVPSPKVIDFGIAKAIAGRLTGSTMSTGFNQFLGTPAYMSPEQAEMSGLDVDTRTDIYSLGVVLYELLAGRPPFDQQMLLNSGLDAMRRTLREIEPKLPSTLLVTLPDDDFATVAKRRHTDPKTLVSQLRRDLNWVVMKALEKDRRRRYETANGLALDVRRYLENEPVLARPPSRLYRFQKLVLRNKVVFAAGAVATLALVAGLGTAMWFFVREKESRQGEARLRVIADQARENEAMLRREAETQVKINQAAILISRNKFAEADDLVDKIDLPVMRPSLEAAGLFRNLADWHISQGHWQAAANRMLTLVKANEIDKTDMTDAATEELIKVGPVLVLIGDTDDYRRFTRSLIARFSQSSNPVAAEHVIKASTLLPMDAGTIQSLTPLVNVAETSFNNAAPKSIPDIHWMAWRAFALARFEYRSGNFTNAIAWSRKCMAISKTESSRIIGCDAMLALAYQKLGQTNEAEQALADARTLLGSRFPDGLSKGLPTKTDPAGSWHAWVESLLLLNEAVETVEGVAPPPLIPVSASPPSLE